jgi:hypothetical protein
VSQRARGFKEKAPDPANAKSRSSLELRRVVRFRPDGKECRWLLTRAAVWGLGSGGDFGLGPQIAWL